MIINGYKIGPGAKLSGANLSGARLPLRGFFRGVDLSDADLSNADLSGSNLLFRANLQNADLSFANLQKADLTGANLCSTNLICADLRHANLSRVSVDYGTLLVYAKLHDVNLTGVNFMNFSNEAFQFAEWNEVKENGE